MKNFIRTILLAILLVPAFMEAQDAAGPINGITSFPVVYKYDEQVTRKTFTSGSGRHLNQMRDILTIHLTSQNYIMKAIWCGVSH